VAFLRIGPAGFLMSAFVDLTQQNRTQPSLHGWWPIGLSSLSPELGLVIGAKNTVNTNGSFFGSNLYFVNLATRQRHCSMAGGRPG
jgi:hypothetical protein|tara:strand:- start:505 stop:762 length:258 start_codon:yes stop_codon:yes gene_type:complete